MKEVIFDEPLYLGFHHKTKIEIPENYDELSGDQFVALVSYSKGWIGEEDFLLLFLGVKQRILKKLDRWAMYNVNRLLDFLKDVRPLDKLMVTSLTAEIDGKPVKLLPPGQKLNGMTFQQFMTVDTFYSWWLYASKTTYLHSFVTTLYTDPSLPFSEIDPERYKAGILAREENSRDVMEAIVVNWMMIKQWLSRSYPFLFPAPPADDPKAPQKKQRPGSWLDIYDSLVDDDLTRVESYQSLMAMDVIRVLNSKIKNSKKKK